MSTASSVSRQREIQQELEDEMDVSRKWRSRTSTNQPVAPRGNPRGNPRDSRDCQGFLRRIHKHYALGKFSLECTRASGLINNDGLRSLLSVVMLNARLMLLTVGNEVK